MSRRAAPLAAALLLLLAGCAGPEWRKPGAGEAALRADRDACRAVALAAAPPHLVAGSPGAPAGNDVECRRLNPGAAACVTVRTPAPFTTVDDNEPARHAAFGRCMEERGWRRDGRP